MTSGTVLRAVTLCPGEAWGELVLLQEPLSFWGGFDPASGRITDRHHPQFGMELSGKVLAMPGGRGSSSSSSILAEAIRRGSAPCAILLAQSDAIIVLGAVVAAELYAKRCPVALAADDWHRLGEARQVSLTAQAFGPAVIEIMQLRQRSP